MSTEPCSHCGWRPVYAKAMCKLDYEALRRTGEPRPFAVVIEDAKRWEVRKVAINARREAERRYA